MTFEETICWYLEQSYNAGVNQLDVDLEVKAKKLLNEITSGITNQERQKLREFKRSHNKKSTASDLKLRYDYRPDGSVYGLQLYCTPNAGHGFKPIARFHPEFVDVIANAERIVTLWNEAKPVPDFVL